MVRASASIGRRDHGHRHHVVRRGDLHRGLGGPGTGLRGCHAQDMRELRAKVRAVRRARQGGPRAPGLECCPPNPPTVTPQRRRCYRHRRRLIFIWPRHYALLYMLHTAHRTFIYCCIPDTLYITDAANTYLFTLVLSAYMHACPSVHPSRALAIRASHFVFTSVSSAFSKLRGRCLPSLLVDDELSHLIASELKSTRHA